MTAYWQVCWPLAPSSCCFIFTELMDHTLLQQGHGRMGILHGL